VPPPIRLLDIGGTESFWETMGFVGRDEVEITLCNLTPLPAPRHPGIRLVQGDACKLEAFDDDEFDVVFSNSVIEHVGELTRCQAMADEVRRVGRRYFVQTPNRYFPTDPHFPFPLFQFLPLEARARLLQALPLAWVGRIRDPANAREVAQSVRLLSEREFRALFPGCSIYREKFLGLTKSFIAYAGW
jgi:SAM-dependent methyltransferase